MQVILLGASVWLALVISRGGEGPCRYGGCRRTLHEFLGLQLPQRGGQRRRRLLDIPLGVRGTHETCPAEQVDSAEQHAAVQRRRHLRVSPPDFSAAGSSSPGSSGPSSR